MSVITTEVISSDSKVDLEPCPKRGSDKIYSLRPRRKNTRENKSYRTAWTHKREPSTQKGWNPMLREEPIKPQPQ